MNEEQKRREMQIERMQEDLLNCLVFSRNGGVKCRETAEALYNAGYRKADEVRKETAKDICDWLEYRFKLYDYVIEKPVKDSIKIICKKYGVEVEE